MSQRDSAKVVAKPAPLRYNVQHDTYYSYSSDVVHSRQLLHLTPRSSPWQTTLASSIRVSPTVANQQIGEDAFGNPISRFEVDRLHSELHVQAALDVDVHARPNYDDAATLSWQLTRELLCYRAEYHTPERLEAGRYRTESQHAVIKEPFAVYAAECFAKDHSILAAARLLMRKIYEEFTYAPGETHIGTPLVRVLETKRGVCQDFAHLMIACLRTYGLAARYVSGYLRTEPPEGMPRLIGADASHAWVGVWCPPLGWIDLDPTNGVLVNQDHITLAWGRDFGDVSPLRGMIVGGGQNALSVSVTVTPVDEAETEAESKPESESESE